MMSYESCLTNGYLDETIIDWIPGMPPMSLGDVSSFVRTTDPDDFGLWFNITEANNCTKAGALIINTFDALEADVLAALRAEYPRIYTVGPLGTLLCPPPHRAHPAQLAEFAWGVAAMGRPFLWVVREELVAGAPGGGPAALPPEFLAETAGRRCVAAWCPQKRVLRHRAVGCFVTHNGWNSTCEGVAAGVPMVCWPVFADQYTNCKNACEVWGVGLRLDAEVRREQVAAHVGEAMASEEMRRNAARWKAEAEAAARPGGSSHENLLTLVKALSTLKPEP
ncbi:hypothetical protein ACP70R_003402 [Stipagrostis hirtigluma subsp. patula]